MSTTIEGADAKGAPTHKLTAEEEAATKKFLENVNKWRTANNMKEVICRILRDKTMAYKLMYFLNHESMMHKIIPSVD